MTYQKMTLHIEKAEDGYAIEAWGTPCGSGQGGPRYVRVARTETALAKAVRVLARRILGGHHEAHMWIRECEL